MVFQVMLLYGVSIGIQVPEFNIWQVKRNTIYYMIYMILILEIFEAAT